MAAAELIADTATDLANIGSTTGSGNSAAVAASTGVLPAAADEVFA
ncbi:PE family protein [Mycobacterium sp.]